MALFLGVARKLAVVFVALSGFGWVACTVGCVCFIANVATYPTSIRTSIYATSEPYYSAIVIGVIVCIGAVIQAALWRRWSAIAGTVTALLSVKYLATIGYVLHSTGIDITLWQSREVHYWDYLMFIGGLISCFFWAFVLMLWPFYSNPPQDGDRDTTRAKLFKGAARKVAIIFILLSIVGWVFTCVGIGLLPRYSPLDYPYWSVCLMGPLTYIAALIHAGSWKGVSKAMGAAAAFLSVIYITAVGFITVSVGMHMYRIDHNENPAWWPYNAGVPSWMKWQFSGGIILCFFWAIVLMLWPWYSHTSTVSSTDVETQPLITTARQSIHQC